MRTLLRLSAVCMVVLVMALLVAGQTATAQMKKMRVGLVYDVGGKGDLSFNDMAYAKVETKDLEPAAGGENREELLRLLAGEKYDLMFGIGFLFADSITRVAKAFPGVKFAIVDGFIDKEPNVVSVLFKEHEWRQRERA